MLVNGCLCLVGLGAYGCWWLLVDRWWLVMVASMRLRWLLLGWVRFRLRCWFVVVYALRGCLRCGLHFEVCLVAWM